MMARLSQRTLGFSLLIGLVMVLPAASLLADCTVSAGSVAFGDYDPLSQQALDGAGTISVSCSPSASYSLSLSTGGGSYAQRELAGSGSVLNYNLFTTVSRTIVWGDGSGSTATVGGEGDSANHTVYGRIPAQQNVTAGSYSDSIVVTVTF